MGSAVDTAVDIDKAMRLQEQMVALIRAFGLNEPDRTPCGEQMSVSEAHTLMELDKNQLLSQNQLAYRLRLEKSTVSRLVAQLQKRGWVEQYTAANDGRLRLLTLTDRGRRAANSLSEARRRKYARLFEAIPEKEREAVFHALQVVISALDYDDANNLVPQHQKTETVNATL